MGFLCLRIKIIIGLSRRYDGVVFVLSAIFYRFSRKILFYVNCACFFVALLGETGKIGVVVSTCGCRVKPGGIDEIWAAMEVLYGKSIFGRSEFK